MNRRLSFLAASLFVLLAGCGGGGGGSSTGPVDEGGQLSHVGLFEVRSPGITSTLTAESSSITATALNGTLTGMNLFQPLALSDQTLAVLRFDLVVSYTYLTNPVSGAALNPISARFGLNGMDISLDGTKMVAFADGPVQGLVMVDLASGNQTPITGLPTIPSNPRFSPVKEGGKYRIAFASGDTIYTVLEDGTDLQTVSNPGASTDSNPSYSADGTKIVFQRTYSGNDRCVVATYSGGGTWSESGLLNYGTVPQFTPDGNNILHVAPGDFGVSRYSMIDQSVIPICGGDDLWLYRQSPDGRYIAFQDGTLQLYDTLLGTTTTISPSAALLPFSWGPQTSRRSFVGTSGLFATKASGAILTQTSSSAASVVSFAANDSTTATLDMQTPAQVTGPVAVFELGADKFKWLAYAQGPDWKRVDIVGGTQPVGIVTGALVSLSSSTGLVASVLTFTAPHSPDRSAKPRLSKWEGYVEASGTFVGVYDSTGRNLAPSGASLVRIDEATGTPTVVR